MEPQGPVSCSPMEIRSDPTAVRGQADEAAADREVIAVIGLGYVGLPLAVDLVRKGYRVLAIDKSLERIERLTAIDSYVDDVAPAALAHAMSTRRLVLSDATTGCAEATVVFICVPTPVTPRREPDLRPILEAGNYVARTLVAGDVVVLQSTTYPGTTLGPLRDVLESSSGLRAGRDFGLAFSPERTSPGDGLPASSIPRLVGGIDRATTERVAAILRHIAPAVSTMTSPDAAEMAKLFENVFRNVNIALVNELALICEKLQLDVWEVLAGASTKPFGFMPFYPGPGVGGHCIPVDPYYMSARAREVGYHERFIETAGDINSRMPNHVTSLVGRALNARGKPVRGSHVLVIGVAFKAGVSDDRNSPAGPIILGLERLGAIVSYHDPRLPTFLPREQGMTRAEPLISTNLAEALDAAPDCVLIVTPHPELDFDLLFERGQLIVDTRNASKDRNLRPGQVLRLGAGWS